MKFCEFKKTVEERKPEVTVYQHGTPNTVDVLFNNSNKLYTYRGTYCEVMNRLGIKSMTKCDLWQYEVQLINAKQKHGSVDLFGDVIDNTAKIRELEMQIESIKNEYVII